MNHAEKIYIHTHTHRKAVIANDERLVFVVRRGNGKVRFVLWPITRRARRAPRRNCDTTARLFCRKEGTHYAAYNPASSPARESNNERSKSAIREKRFYNSYTAYVELFRAFLLLLCCCMHARLFAVFINIIISLQNCTLALYSIYDYEPPRRRAGESFHLCRCVVAYKKIRRMKRRFENKTRYTRRRRRAPWSSCKLQSSCCIYCARGKRERRVLCLRKRLNGFFVVCVSRARALRVMTMTRLYIHTVYSARVIFPPSLSLS